MSQTNRLRLGVNIDHVATLRQARYAHRPGSPHAEPSVVKAALEAEAGGADGITAHLREDRRHIQDRDIAELRKYVNTTLNLELGNTAEIVGIALATQPDYACLVPENRKEVTTEGGLDVRAARESLASTTSRLQDAGIKVSLFVDPEPDDIEAAAEIGADIVELHTGRYANASDAGQSESEAARLAVVAALAHRCGLQVNAGHGITNANLPGLFDVPHLVELNIGHHLISRAIDIGLRAAVGEMRETMAGYSADEGAVD